MSRRWVSATTVKTSVSYSVSRSTSLSKPKPRLKGRLVSLWKNPTVPPQFHRTNIFPIFPQRDLRTFVTVTVLGKGNYLHFLRTVEYRV